MGLGFTGHRIVDAGPTFVETPLLRTDLIDLCTHELVVSRLDTASRLASPRTCRPRTIHAGRNTSRMTPFKFLLIRVHRKGDPLSVELQ